MTTATTAELKDLAGRIENELAQRELEDQEPAESRRVVEARPASAGTLRLEMVKCGKRCCKKRADGGGHGPLWFLYFRRNG